MRAQYFIFISSICVLALSGCVTPRSTTSANISPDIIRDYQNRIFDRQEIDGWVVTALAEDAELTRIDECSADYTDENQTVFTIILRNDWFLELAMDNPKWDLEPEMNIYITYEFGSQSYEASQSMIYSNTGVSFLPIGGELPQFQPDDIDDLIRTLAESTSIRIWLKGISGSIVYPEPKRALKKVFQCMTQYSKEGLTVKLRDLAPDLSKPKKYSKAYWDDRLNWFSKGLLENAEMGSFEPVPPEKLAEVGNSLSIAWTNGEVIGGVQFVDSLFSGQEALGLISDLTQQCHQGYSSEFEKKSLPNGGVVNRVVLHCDGIGSYFFRTYPLSDYMGSFILVHFSPIPSEAKIYDERTFTVISSGVAGSIERGR